MGLDVAFWLSEAQAGGEIWDLAPLGRLQGRLLGGAAATRPPLTFRYAPSIVARTEAELFGLSTPRFSVRVYFGDEGGSFCNARRINEFAARSPGWSTRQPKDRKHQASVDGHPIEQA